MALRCVSTSFRDVFTLHPSILTSTLRNEVLYKKRKEQRFTAQTRELCGLRDILLDSRHAQRAALLERLQAIVSYNFELCTGAFRKHQLSLLAASRMISNGGLLEVVAQLDVDVEQVHVPDKELRMLCLLRDSGRVA